MISIGFTLDAIAYWNALDMQAVLDQLAREGREINPVDVARISPLVHRHINMTPHRSIHAQSPSPQV
ncbi:MAG: Tn3 family transposase [Albidovulum sp.]|nr:Tn3 family transposase [Albidovulum sp.]